MKYVVDLFDPEPLRWGLRGDPWVWRALRGHLSGTYLPPTLAETEALLFTAFNRIVAVDLANETAPSVYRAEFARRERSGEPDGVSHGHVSIPVWRDDLLPLLLDRADRLLRGIQ